MDRWCRSEGIPKDLLRFWCFFYGQLVSNLRDPCGFYEVLGRFMDCWCRIWGILVDFMRFWGVLWTAGVGLKGSLRIFWGSGAFYGQLVLMLKDLWGSDLIFEVLARLMDCWCRSWGILQDFVRFWGVLWTAVAGLKGSLRIFWGSGAFYELLVPMLRDSLRILEGSLLKSGRRWPMAQSRPPERSLTGSSEPATEGWWRC